MSAASKGIDHKEVVDVVYAANSIQILVGDKYIHSIQYIGGLSDRVLFVITDRMDRNIDIFEITSVSFATEGEARAWKMRQ